jgi:hypothetical protein
MMVPRQNVLIRFDVKTERLFLKCLFMDDFLTGRLSVSLSCSHNPHNKGQLRSFAYQIL